MSQCKECFHDCVCNREIGYGWSECPHFISSANVTEIRHGRWKLCKDGSGICDECGRISKNVWDYDNYQNYCGHCGAKMKL